MITFCRMYFFRIFPAIVWVIIITVIGISGSSSIINNTSAIHASLLLTTSPVSITATTKAGLDTRPSFTGIANSVILVPSLIKTTSGQQVSTHASSTNTVTEYTHDIFISQSILPTRNLTSVASPRNSNTRVFSHVVQNNTSLLQMLSASIISKHPNLSSVSRTSIGTSRTATFLGSSTLLAQSNTSSSHSSFSSEVFEPTAILSEANATRTSVAATHNNTVMESSLPKVQNKTATIQVIASSKIPNATIAFSTARVLRTSVEVSKYDTVMRLSSFVAENNTSIIQAMISSKIFKTSSTFATADVLRTSVEVSRTSSPVVKNKTSMLHTIRLSTNFKTLALFSWVNTTRTSVEVSHNRTTLRPSLPLVQSKTTSTLKLAFSENINATKTSVEISHTSTTLLSSVPLVQSKATANYMSSPNDAYKTTIIYSESSDTRTSVGVSLNKTFMSSLPDVLLTTSLVHSIPSSTDVSLEFKISRTSTFALQNSTITLSSPPIFHNGTSGMYMRPSYKVSENTAVFSELYVPGTSVSVSRNFTATVSTLPILHNKTSIVQVIVSSEISKVASSKGLFSSSKALEKSLYEIYSNRLPVTQYMTLEFSLTLQPVTERISMPNITGASTTRLFAEVTSRHSSNINLNTLWNTNRSTSSVIIINPSKGSVTVKKTLPYGSVSKTTSLRRSTVSRDSRWNSTEPTLLTMPSPFLATTSNSIIFNPTVEKTSQAVPSPSKDTIFMAHRTSTLLSAAAKSSFSSITVLSSITTTKRRQQKPTSTVSALKLSSAHTSIAHYSYSNLRGTSSDIFSSVSRKSTPQSFQMVSTFITKEVILSSALHTNFTHTPMLTHESGRSSRTLTSKSSHIMQSLTSLTSSTRQEPLGSVTFTTTTPRVTLFSTLIEENLSKRNSKTSPNVLQKTESITSRLSTVVSTYKSSSTPEEKSLFKASQTIRSLISLQKTIRSTGLLSIQTTSTGGSASRSTKYILELASLTAASQRQSTLASLLTFSRDSKITSSSSYPLVTSSLSSNIVPPSYLVISKSSHIMQSLNSLTSPTRKKPLGSLTIITATPRVTLVSTLTEENLSKRNSQTSPSVLQKTDSITSRLSTVVSIYKSSSTSEERSISTDSQTIRSLMSSQKIMRSTGLPSTQTTLTSVSESHSTKYILEFSNIITASQRQSTLVSLPSFSKDSRFTLPSSYPLPTFTLSSGVVPTSSLAISPDGKMTMVTPVSVESLYSSETSAVLFDSVRTRHLTFPSKPKSTLNSMVTQSSIESLALSSFDRRSGATLDISPSSTTFMPSPASTVLVSVQTGPPPENPKQFEGHMVLQIPWNSQYQTTYTPEYQDLASLITRELGKALKTLEGFLSVQVLRFWKSSVGVDFVVFIRKSVQINETTIERTLIEANNTGELDLPITSLQVTERKATTHPSVPTQSVNKSLERWEIILIVTGVLVFLLLLVICILAVKLARRSGRFNRSQKYELSSRCSNYIYSDYPDSVPRTKTNLPVILSMENTRTWQCDKQDSHEDLSTYNITESKSEESLAHNSCETQLQESTNFEIRNTSDECRLPATAAAEEGSVSTEAYPAAWNKGYEAVSQL